MESLLSTGVQEYVERGKQKLLADKAHRNVMMQKKFDTIAVHGMYSIEEALRNQGSIIEPVFLSSAQHYENSDHLEAAQAYLTPSWAYTRISNPTLVYLEQTLSMLEGYGFDGETSAVVTSSGMSAVFMATNPFLEVNGSPINIVADAKCYGGTFMLFNERYAGERGVDVRWVKDSLNVEEWEEKIDENTRFVFVEMPSNPSLSMADIEKLAKMAHAHDIPLIVDSTLSTPALMRPLCHGADIIVHSVSKAMALSGSAIAGAIISRKNIPSKVGSDEMREDFATYVKLWPMRDHGPSLSPLSAYMVLNDLRTLRTRLDKMSQNTMKVANFLNEHPNVESVAYPGLSSQAGHEIANKYMWLADGEDDYGTPVNRYGYLLSFNVKGGHQASREVLDNLNMIWMATDLGRVKTIANIPAISTHKQQGDKGRELASLPSHLIRLSVGMEHPDNIIEDLDAALKSIKNN